jgi:hypothetical protein
MKLIARRGETEAWADEPFDPKTDEVELRAPGQSPHRVRWQSALKFGYWEPANGDE